MGETELIIGVCPAAADLAQVDLDVGDRRSGVVHDDTGDGADGLEADRDRVRHLLVVVLAVLVDRGTA